MSNHYAHRMQIEESFRDRKSHRWGFGLRYALSDRPKRLDILLPLGTLGSLVAWLIGLVARNLQIERHFQANSVGRSHSAGIRRLENSGNGTPAAVKILLDMRGFSVGTGETLVTWLRPTPR